MARAQRTAVYFTGKACIAGHVADRFVSSRQCVICSHERKRRWAAKNPTHVSAYQKQYIDDNRNHVNARNAVWRRDNPDRVKRTKAADYKRHKPKRAASAKRWRSENIEKVRDIDRLKVLASPEQYRTYKRNYKVRKRNAPGRHTGEDVLAILKAQGGKCAYCRTGLKSKYHVDHILALSKGGSNDRSNLQILCQPCNQSKSAKDPIVFAQSRGMLL